jgi:hypothetical protein
LVCAKYHALTAATDLFQQFVIAYFSQDLCQALAARDRTSCLIDAVGGGADPGYRLALERTFKKTTWAASFWGIGWNFRPAPFTNSGH